MTEKQNDYAEFNKNTVVTKTGLFNPNANTEKQTMFTGESTGIIDMIDQVIVDFYQKHTERMFSNSWHPLRYSVSDDKKDFEQMDEALRNTFDRCLSHLTNLDSLQVGNLPEISSRIRYGEVKGVLAYQEMEESLHSFSYAYIYNSLYTKEEARKVRDLLKTDSVMRKKGEDIKRSYELDEDTLGGQLNILLANLCLEGIMFYSIFNFFFFLKYNGLMINTAIEITWIKKNEVTHIDIFIDLLLQFKKEYPNLWEEQHIINFIKSQVELETEYSSYVIDSSILGFSKDNIKKYTQHRANELFWKLGIDFRYKTENVFKHLERVGNVEDVSSSETGIFESHSSHYFDPVSKIQDYKEFLNG